MARLPPSKPVQHALDRQYGPDGPGRPGVVAFCYGCIFRSRAEVPEEAGYHCGGAGPVAQDQDVIWTPCPLFQPMRASFICKPAPPAPEAEPAPQAE